MQITFIISEEKVQRVVGAIKGLFPVPTDGDGNPLFTDGQWAKEKIRRSIIEIVHRYESKKAQEAAKTLVQEDDSLVS